MEGFPYALDNGAWTAYQQRRPWEAQPFWRALQCRGAGAEWVVLPDIVAGGESSLARSLSWLSHGLEYTQRVLLAVQDGMTPALIRPHLTVAARIGIFVGGSTAWKLRTLPLWGTLAAEMGCWLHVGRVNTARRITLCGLVGATSFDGTSVSRFATTLPLLEHARQQLPLKQGWLHARTPALD
jgi:hypothetical protein